MDSLVQGSEQLSLEDFKLKWLLFIFISRHEGRAVIKQISDHPDPDSSSPERFQIGHIIC